MDREQAEKRLKTALESVRSSEESLSKKRQFVDMFRGIVSFEAMPLLQHEGDLPTEHPAALAEFMQARADWLSIEVYRVEEGRYDVALRIDDTYDSEEEAQESADMMILEMMMTLRLGAGILADKLPNWRNITPLSERDAEAA